MAEEGAGAGEAGANVPPLDVATQAVPDAAASAAPRERSAPTLGVTGTCRLAQTGVPLLETICVRERGPVRLIAGCWRRRLGPARRVV